MKAVLFDLDGTLLDTLEDLADGVNYALTCYGYPTRSLEEVRAFVGNGAYRLIKLSCPDGTPEERVQEVLSCYSTYYNAHCRCKTAPYSGCLEALAELKSRYAIAIVSNKPDKAVKALCSDFFPGTYALGELPDCPRKPNADMLWRAMGDIGAREAVYVGDSEVDILTAQNAGMPCLSVTWGFRSRDALVEAGGRAFCDDRNDLTASIDALFQQKQ